jgi:rare lipoprotein A
MDSETVNDIEGGDGVEVTYDIERAEVAELTEVVEDVKNVDAERDCGPGGPSRSSPVVCVLAAAALSLVGIAGGVCPTDAAAVVDEIPPPPAAVSPRSARIKPNRISPLEKPDIDRTGRKRVGKASFYARMFAGRKMADGNRMRPTGNNAASLTLPLGTTAQVTNLATGKTAVITIQDRGPYVAGRIVDLSPATARQIGLDRRTGVTEVEVAPITVPLPDGHIKLGDGALEANNNVTVTTHLR